MKGKKTVLPNMYSLHFKTIKKYLPDISKISTLEVGCQTAYFSIPFAEKEAKVVCIDNEPSELQKGKEMFEEFNLKGDFYLMDGFDLEFEDDSFDLVFNHGVIEHFKPTLQDRMLQEMKRVSKKYVYISVPNKFHRHTQRTLRQSKIEKERKEGNPWTWQFYPPSFWGFHELLTRNNLKIKEFYGSIHGPQQLPRLSQFLKRTLGLLLSFELCALAEKINRD